MAEATQSRWDTNYEWKVVLLLALGFGLVGMDRFVINALWNTIAQDTGLDPGAIGNLAGLTAVAWGAFAIVFGRLADRWGHRKILLWSIILFSLLGGVTGLATGMVFFIVVRTMLGSMEGAYTPTSFAAVAVASKPSRRGLNQGLQQCGVSLLGLALAPIVATQLLNAGMSWRMVFIVIALPGFIVAAFLWKVLKEPKDTQGAEALGVIEDTSTPSVGEMLVSYLGPLKSYNIVVCTIALLGAMCGLFTLAAMVPVYLENFIQLDIAQMGVVTSAIGFGGFFGQFSWPGLSDKIGRKPVCIIGFAAAAHLCVLVHSNRRRYQRPVLPAVPDFVFLLREYRPDHRTHCDRIGARRPGGCIHRSRGGCGRDLRRRSRPDHGLFRHSKLWIRRSALRGPDWHGDRVRGLPVPEGNRTH